MSWVGGKKALRDEVLIRFPLEYQTYVEVFGGAGWVLFHKEPGRDKEVYNDFNSNLVNLYRCVRGNSGKLKKKLRYVLNSREDFNWLEALHRKGIFPRFRDYDRAAKFYQLIIIWRGFRQPKICRSTKKYPLSSDKCFTA